MHNTKKNRLIDKSFQFWGIGNTFIGIVLLAIFIGYIVYLGASRLSFDFLSSLPSRFPDKSGIYTAMVGSVWIMFLTAIFAIPIGVSAAIYLEEYQKKNRFANILEINISNLAGVPSIIYGLLGLQVFSRTIGLGGNLLAGALTLSLLILPIIIVATREALKAVPNLIKDASYALGATKWQTIRHQILPAASGGIMTGIILSISRAVGEAAPLIVVGALAYVPFVPTSPMDDFSVLPIQIFNWISRPQAGFIVNAAAGIIVLLVITFSMNLVAILIRNKFEKKMN
ncbi:MAG: phosphate ABC transporter permease PstA [Paludibacteraceae bacterium]|nr:phosphate ABC transporter permease PstA [Paludibacteraceae bacterium]MBN2787697.1 phosphate ABC transporter permease PstA [Paludibacteraceae bacterium]